MTSAAVNNIFSESVRLVIYGKHSRDWQIALAPEALVWSLLPEIREVVSVAADGSMPIVDDGLRTVVLPLMEKHMLACPPHAFDSFMPSAVAIETLMNKQKFADYTSTNGLGSLCPRVYASADVAKYPCVLKRTDLNGGNGVAYVENPERLPELIEMAPWEGHPIIIQDFEASPYQYVTHAVCRNGGIENQVSYRQKILDGGQIRCGWSKIESSRYTPTPEKLRALERFMLPLKFSGICNFDYIFRDDGSICVFEINPRLGGSLMMPENLNDLARMIGSAIRLATPLA